VLGDGGAVDLEKGLVEARGVALDEIREQLLARSRLALQQDGGVDGPDAQGQLDDPSNVFRTEMICSLWTERPFRSTSSSS
jgi:hypothetical protein